MPAAVRRILAHVANETFEYFIRIWAEDGYLGG
jgi:hypothetical protein